MESNTTTPAQGTGGRTYVSLHTHSTHSIGDGISTPDDLAKRAAELGMPAMALTDHGRMSGLVSFEKACHEHNVKPIMGMEAYCCGIGRSRSERTNYTADTRDLMGKPGHEKSCYHLILLAKDERGYDNLCRLTTESYATGFYYKPRIDYELLHEHRDGLIVCSACVLGELSMAVQDQDIDKARRVIEWFKGEFGDDYFVEVQNHGLSMELSSMRTLRELADDSDVRTIVTNDSHYTLKGDAKLQKTVMLINRHKSWADEDVHGSFFDDASIDGQKAIEDEHGGEGDSDPIFETSSELYVKSYDEMVEALRPNGGEDGRVEQELANTLEIADRCRYEIPFIDPSDTDAYYLPTYDVKTDVRYEEYERSSFSIPKYINDACVRELREEGHTEVNDVSDYLDEHDMEALRFLMWLCEDGMRKRVIPKIDAGGNPMPDEMWIKNKPEGLHVIHTHKSPDEQWVRKQIDSGHDRDDMIQQYRDRLAYETGVVVAKRFVNYFLIVQSYVNYVRAQGEMVGPGRGCVTPDTMILTADGGSKPVSEIMPGNFVYDEKGVPSEVKDLYEYDTDEMLCDITVTGGKHVKLTQGHLVLVAKGRHDAPLEWLPASCIERGDWMLTMAPTFPAGNDIVRSDDGYACLMVSDVSTFRYAGIVYDIKVDTKNEPSYATEAGIIHNSGAGSLLNYLSGITSVDPIPNDLLFFRFLNKDRKGYPDIDVDFSSHARDDLLWPHLREVYGKDSTAMVAAYTYFWGKAAIKAAARVLFDCSSCRTMTPEQRRAGKDESITLSNALCDLIDNKPHLDLRDELTDELDANGRPLGNEPLKALIKTDVRYQQIIELALMLQGMISGESQHASAYILSPHPIVDRLPLMVSKEERERSTASGKPVQDYIIQYDGREIQDQLGYVKMDLLCINDLEVITQTIKKIHDAYGVDIDIDNIPLDCKTTFDLLRQGKTAGVFQFDGSPVPKRLIVEGKADKIADLSIINALDRPGALLMGMDKDFIERKNDPSKITYFTPAAKDVLEGTYGLACFQESNMLLAQDKRIVGFTESEADTMRKILAHKDKSKIAWIVDLAHKRAKENGVPEKIVNDFCDIAVAAGSYAFNCITGDTLLHRANTATRDKKFPTPDITVEEVYRRFNASATRNSSNQPIRGKYRSKRPDLGLFVMCRDADGRSRRHKVTNVWQQGVRPVFEITLENGKSIKATGNHRFQAADGTYKTVDMLTTNDLLWCCDFIYDSAQKRCPTYMSRIVSIVPCGAEMVYDVEIDSDEHNFFANGICSHNSSHSLAYALIAYRGAFLKTFFPDCFLSSVSQIKPQMKGKDKIPDYLNEARQLGVELRPPHVNWSDIGFSVPEPHVIAYGLERIKGVGAAAQTIVDERHAHGEFTDITDFCCRVPRTVTKTALKALVSAGALDNLGWTRRALEASVDDLAAFRRKWFKEQDKNVGQLSLGLDLGTSVSVTGSGDDGVRTVRDIDALYADGRHHNDHGTILMPPTEEEFPPYQMMEREHDAFGMYFSMTPEDWSQLSRLEADEWLERKRKESAHQNRDGVTIEGRQYRMINVADVPSLPDSLRVVFTAMVEDVTPKFGDTRGYRLFKSGKGATVFLIDWGVGAEGRFGFSPSESRVRLTCFERVWNGMPKPAPNAVVLVWGRVSVSDKFPTSVIADGVRMLPYDAVRFQGRKEQSEELMGRLRGIAESAGNPSSSAYLVPRVSLPGKAAYERFVRDGVMHAKYDDLYGTAIVTYDGCDDDDSDHIMRLAQTMGMVRYARDKYGATVTKVRLPIAESELARRF